MLRTLLFIPHEIAGIPVFGVGWALGLIVLAFVGRLGLAAKRKESIGEVISGEAIMWLVIAAIIVFVVPRLELTNLDNEPVGMAVRGYGVMLVCAVVSSIGLAAWRAKNRGINSDAIYGMAPYVMICGIIGARVFYVIQYRDQYIGSTAFETFSNMVAFTQGGLVVYGSFIGGVTAGLIYAKRHKIPILRLGDALVPSMFLGVCIGRIGCLMNCCCYGGQCADNWYSLYFPSNTEVYNEQMESGALLGLSVNPISKRIDEVVDGSLAADAGIRVGQEFKGVRVDLKPLDTAPRDIPAEEAEVGRIAVVDSQVYRWHPDQLPDRALAVQPAQLISSGTALMLMLVLCALSPFARRNGTIMMLGFAGYAIVRFVLEIVRVDEGGQFGTQLTISQWVSVIVFASAICGLIWIYRQPRGVDQVATPEAA